MPNRKIHRKIEGGIVMKKHLQPLTPAALYARVSSEAGC